MILMLIPTCESMLNVSSMAMDCCILRLRHLSKSLEFEPFEKWNFLQGSDGSLDRHFLRAITALHRFVSFLTLILSYSFEYACKQSKKTFAYKAIVYGSVKTEGGEVPINSLIRYRKSSFRIYLYHFGLVHSLYY